MKKSIIQKKKVNSSFSKDKLEFFINTVAKFCDKCGNQYSTKDLNLVQESEHSSIIHFTCSNCKSRHIATFVAPLGISSRTPINTDLNVKEISRFARNREIPADELIDVHNLFNKKKSVKL